MLNQVVKSLEEVEVLVAEVVAEEALEAVEEVLEEKQRNLHVWQYIGVIVL